MKIERASNRSIDEVIAFNAGFHIEHGYLPLDEEKALQSVELACRHHTVFNARTVHGRIVGSLALVVSEPWYSTAKIMDNIWFNVIPGDQKAGEACRMLLAEAKLEAERKKVAALIITRWNDRKKHQSEFGRIAEVVGFIPFGNEFRMRLK